MVRARVASNEFEMALFVAYLPTNVARNVSFDYSVHCHLPRNGKGIQSLSCAMAQFCVFPLSEKPISPASVGRQILLSKWSALGVRNALHK